MKVMNNLKLVPTLRSINEKWKILILIKLLKSSKVHHSN